VAVRVAPAPCQWAAAAAAQLPVVVVTWEEQSELHYTAQHLSIASCYKSHGTCSTVSNDINISNDFTVPNAV